MPRTKRSKTAVAGEPSAFAPPLSHPVACEQGRSSTPSSLQHHGQCPHLAKVSRPPSLHLSRPPKSFGQRPRGVLRLLIPAEKTGPRPAAVALLTLLCFGRHGGALLREKAAGFQHGQRRWRRSGRLARNDDHLLESKRRKPALAQAASLPLF